MAKVTMPQLGESVAEGTIGKWLKQPGDHVDKYEPLVEVITDKVNAEVPSPFEGVLREILAEEGADRPQQRRDRGHRDGRRRRGAPTRRRGPERAAAAATAAGRGARRPPRPTAPTAAPAPPPAAAAGARAARRSARRQPPAPPASDERGPPSHGRRGRGPPATADPDARMTPAVRRLLREHELTAAQIVGTGGGGRITRDDVLKVVESIRTGGAAPAPATAGRDAGQNGAAAPASRGRPRPPGRAAAAGPAPDRPARRSSSPKAPTKSSCR